MGSIAGNWRKVLYPFSSYCESVTSVRAHVARHSRVRPPT